MNETYERWKRLKDDPHLRKYCIESIDREIGGLRYYIERGNYYDAVGIMEALVARLRVAAGNLDTEIPELIEFFSKAGE